MHELDRILDGEDVAFLGLVLVVDHRREGGGFARAGRARHQHHAARLVGDRFERFRALQVGQRHDLRRNRPQYRRGAAVLHESVDAKARQVRDRERKVALQILFVELPLPVVHDVVEHAVHVFMLHRGQVDALDVAMYADHRRQARRKVQVGGLVLDDKRKQFGDVHYNFLVTAAW